MNAGMNRSIDNVQAESTLLDSRGEARALHVPPAVYPVVVDGDMSVQGVSVADHDSPP